MQQFTVIKGVVADGNGCLAYLISHNFAYVGTGKDVENDDYPNNPRK